MWCVCVHRRQLSFLTSHSPFLSEAVSFTGSWSLPVSLAYFAASPRVPPVSAFPALGLQVYSSKGFLAWVLALKLSSLCTCNKHFTGGAVAIAPSLGYFSCNGELEVSNSPCFSVFCQRCHHVFSSVRNSLGVCL